MKKISKYFVVILMSAIGLTSCLEGNNVSEGYAFGVLGYSNSNLILKSTVGNVYSPSVNTMDLGECYYFQYSYDADLPENASSVVEARGYSTISILAQKIIPSYYLSTSLTDTSEVMSGELVISKVYDGSSYIEGRFVISQYAKHASDLEYSDVHWDLSYDYSTMMPTEGSDGKRYYDLFCRANAIKSSTKTKVDVQHINAYRVNNYLSNAAVKEKAALGGSYSASSSTFTLRFNYISNIDENNNKTWSTTTTDILIANFLPTSE